MGVVIGTDEEVARETKREIIVIDWDKRVRQKLLYSGTYLKMGEKLLYSKTNLNV